MSKREKLRRKWEGRGILGFLHIGAKCPACGFVFTKGFSTLTYPGGASALDQTRESCTICTRCRTILIVDHNPIALVPLRVMDEARKRLLTPDDHKAMADMKELLDCYTEDWQ